MKIAIPVWKDKVAPILDTASRLLIVEVVDQVVKLTHKEPLVLVKEKKGKEVEMDKIKIAIPVARGKLCSHFGHCDQFALIEAENGEIKGKSMHTPPPHEPGVLPEWLHEQGANIVIAGGMEARAQQHFRQHGIKVITGAPMDFPESLVDQYLADSLVTGENVCDH